MIAHPPFAEDNAGKQSHEEPCVAHDPVACLLSWRSAGLASDDFLKEQILHSSDSLNTTIVGSISLISALSLAISSFVLS